MAENARLFISLPKEEMNLFESEREKLGFTRGQYLRYLQGGRKEIRPAAIRDRELISLMAELERDLRIIAMKPSVSGEEKLLLMAKLDDLKKKM